MIFRPFILFFSLKSIFNDKMISQWEHHIPEITCDKGIECSSTRIELFYFDDYFPSHSSVGFSLQSMRILNLRLQYVRLLGILIEY